MQLPHVWRGRDLAQAEDRALSTGHAELDRLLPGGGWPLGCLVEILNQQPEHHVWQLLLPALVAAARQPGPIVLVNAPHQPFGPALRAQGLAAEKLLCVTADQPRSSLWAAEQALRCADVCAVLAWLPRARTEELRRLHLVAQQQPERFLVAFRDPASVDQSSPARLRLLVEGTDQLQLRILKRRGPPVLQPLLLPAQSPRLAAWLEGRRKKRAAAPAAPFPVPLVPSAPPGVPTEVRDHAMDRPAALTG